MRDSILQYRILFFSVLVASIAACGGGGGSTTAAEVPTFELLFPSPVSRTDAVSVPVVGQFASGDVASVVSVSVASQNTNVELQLEPNGQWRATLPLTSGDNDLDVTVTTSDGRTKIQRVASTKSQAMLALPTGIVSLDGLLYLIDASSILAVDTTTGAVRVIASVTVGIGPPLVFPRKLSAGPAGTLLVAAGSDLIMIDPGSGVRTVAASFDNRSSSTVISTFAYSAAVQKAIVIADGMLHTIDLTQDLPVAAIEGPELSFHPQGSIVYVPERDLLLVDGFDFRIPFPANFGLFKVDLDSGVATEFEARIAGIPLTSRDIFLEGNSTSLLMVDSVGQIFTVSLITGNALLLHAIAEGTRSTGIGGMAVTDDAIWLTEILSGSVTRIDRTTDTRSFLIDSSVGTGAASMGARKFRWDAANGRLVVLGVSGLMSLNPATGVRDAILSLLPEPIAVGESDPPPEIRIRRAVTPSGLSLSVDGSKARFGLIAETTTIVEVDIASATRSDLLSLDTNDSPLSGIPSRIAIDSAGDVAYEAIATRSNVRGATRASSVFRNDLVSGERQLLVELVDEQSVDGLLLDEINNRLLLVGPVITPVGWRMDVLQFDLASSTLTQLSRVDSSLVDNPGLNHSGPQLALSADANTLYYPVSNQPQFLVIDLHTGEASTLSYASDNAPLFFPHAIEVTPDGRIFASDFVSSIYAIDPLSGARVTISR